MKQPRHVVVAAVIDRLQTQTDPKRVAKEIAAYVMTENRVSELDSILRDVMAHQAKLGNLEATVSSAHTLTPEVVRDVTALLAQHYPAAKNIRIDTVITPEMVGGLRVTLPHEQLDLSMRTQISNFKHSVMAGKE